MWLADGIQGWWGCGGVDERKSRVGRVVVVVVMFVWWPKTNIRLGQSSTPPFLTLHHPLNSPFIFRFFLFHSSLLLFFFYCLHLSLFSPSTINIFLYPTAIFLYFSLPLSLFLSIPSFYGIPFAHTLSFPFFFFYPPSLLQFSVFPTSNSFSPSSIIPPIPSSPYTYFPTTFLCNAQLSILCTPLFHSPSYFSSSL